MLRDIFTSTAPTISDQVTSIIIKAIIPDGVNFIKDLLEPELISLRLVKKSIWQDCISLYRDLPT